MFVYGLCIVPLLSVPVNYSGLHAQIWIPHAPSSLDLVYSTMKRAIGQLDCLHQPSLAVQDGNGRGAIPLWLCCSEKEMTCIANIHFNRCIYSKCIRQNKRSQILHTGPLREESLDLNAPVQFSILIQQKRAGFKWVV